MAKRYRVYEPDQMFLMPPSLREWLPEDHLAYFVSDLVDDLNLSEIEAVYEDEQRGQPPYHPRMMVKVLIYAYCVGVFASRRIEKRLLEDVAFRVLAAGNTPDFRTLSDFRKIHRKALEGLFEQVLRLALRAGAVKLGRVAIDGSKVKANASKHKAMSYGRMKEKEQELHKEVRRLLAEADRQDEAGDARYGKDRSGDELPEELRRRESRLKRIGEAKRALEQEARRQAQQAGQQAGKPEDKKQYNFTDPQSRIMKGSDGFVQGYNCQIAVEENFQLIVGQAVTQAANDKEQLQPLVEAVQQQAGQKPKEVLADSGYCSQDNLKYLARRRIDGYVATERQKHGQDRSACKRGPLPKGASLVERMKRKLQTQVGRRIYAMRKAIVEPVFGQIKQVRGFRQFLLRGLEKVQMEWALVCLTHNILKFYRIIG
ncbi:MAG TPA: IS1182 family transposase [Candidatus Acidoferrales bacterium]|nr:IS1182 family transposase [Candidatus Acidoferrales bacterium]